MYNISKKRGCRCFFHNATEIKEGENNIFLVLPVKHKNLMAL